jgi:acetyl-CoA carboxylase carboxyl transferase subunit beta
MSWFKREKLAADKLPKVEDADRKVRTEGLWQKCEGCRQIIWKKDLEANWNVCPKCGCHSRIDAMMRLRLLFDDGSFEQYDSALRSSDPLQFVDSKKYSDRLDAMRVSTNLADALVSASGTLEGRPVVICSMEPRFIGGSMGSVVG